MALISLQDIEIAYGGAPLLDGANMQIEPRERICLVGRNGEGKSTLLKIVHGAVEPDAGEVVRARATRTAILPQDVPQDLEGRVYDVVAASWDHEHGLDYPVERNISLLDLDPDQPFDTLSGGMKRRALLARALVNDPDLLILDEPTNHLDIESIVWLENFLLRSHATLLFVTHDRMFLQHLATRIVELDRGHLQSWDCDYTTYLRRRQALLDAEDGQWAQFDKRLSQEEGWIRQGIKARRTRNEGRVRALERMRAERSERRERAGVVNIQQNLTERSGRKVIEAKKISHSFGPQKIIADFSCEIQRGDRIGIMGPNGCGKTTLINILLEQLKPDRGSIRHGTRLEISFFDQHRFQLDEQLSVKENLCGNDDFVSVQGGRQHALGYLRDFLFTAERARQPVRSLSGGERNRLMLAKLFARPSNMLVLDEPTNDLDIETLDLLEDILVDYPGTILMVSHDRAFLNNVVTETLVFEGGGRINRYAGGYDDWLAQRPSKTASSRPAKKPKTNPNRKDQQRDGRSTGTRALSNREREELASLPQLIEQLENEQEELSAQLADPGFYRRPEEDIKTVNERLSELPSQIEQAYERWAELE